MLWGLGFVLIIILFILAVIYFYNDRKTENFKSGTGGIIKDPFIDINDNNLYMPITDKSKGKPVDIKYQIPIPQNQLTDLQLQGIDSDILRHVRTLKRFSHTDELDFYQMYNLLKKLKDKTVEFTYDPSSIEKKSHIIASEKLIELNSGVINKTDLELFFRLKLEIISLLNNIVIQNGYYLPYHQYQFFKIINSNLISQDILPAPTTTTDMNIDNYIFTLTIGREFKYQQFIIYFDIDLIKNSTTQTNNITQSDNTAKVDNTAKIDNTAKVNYTVRLNKVELIGLPVPKTIEFHENKKTSDKPDSLSSIMNSPQDFITTSKQAEQNSLLTLIKEKQEIEKNKKQMLDIYKDQVSDSADFDVMPIGDGKMFQSPYTKFIDVTERSDMDPTLFDESSQSAFVEKRVMNVARDQQFKNHRCYGLVDGVSKEMVQYNDNPIFCKSFHPEISQVGIWDAPCQVNSDCPFYKANKNYPNEFGKCDKVSGKCEMPMGVIPIGFTKYGRIEPDCYNCSMDNKDNKCCSIQAQKIRDGTVKYKSPDYIFKDDEIYRKQFGSTLEENGLLINPSII